MIRSLSDLLADLTPRLTNEHTAISELLEAFHERGIGALLFFFALPMAMPLPVPPGINVILATPLLLLTIQQAMGRHKVWMPQKIQKKTLSTQKLKHMIGAAIPLMQKIEILIKPRLGFITQDGPSRLVGVLGFIMALSVCIPLPLTNTVPSFGIALMAIGVIMRDGLAVIAGALIGMAWVAMLCGAVLYFGPEAFDIIKETIKSLL